MSLTDKILKALGGKSLTTREIMKLARIAKDNGKFVSSALIAMTRSGKVAPDYKSARACSVTGNQVIRWSRVRASHAKRSRAA